MRIISKFKDYYDGCNYDNSISSGVFERHTSELPIDWVSHHHGIIADGCNSYDLHTGLIGFCGRLYPYVEYKSYGKPSSFIYTFEEFDELRNEIVLIKPKRNIWYSGSGIMKDWNKKDLARIWFDCDFKTLQGIKDTGLPVWLSEKRCYSGVFPNWPNVQNLFYEHKVPCFVIKHTDIKGAANTGHSLILNPCLKDYMFYRVIDPYICWQEIEYFLSNELVKPDDPYIEPISDKLKAESHGFNKESFRKPKSK